MNNKLITFTLIGKNRPGLVSSIFKKIYNRNVNVQKSLMNRIGNGFVISANVSSPVNEDLSDIINKYSNFHEQNSKSINMDYETDLNTKNTYKVKLNVEREDTPGLIHHVTQKIFENNSDIESLKTFLTNAPFCGTKLFNLETIIDVPNVVPFDKLDSNLKKEFEKRSYDYSISQFVKI